MKKSLLAVFLCGVVGFSGAATANGWVYGDVQMVEDYGGYAGGWYGVLITLQNLRWVDLGGSANNPACTQRFRVVVNEQGVMAEAKNRIYAAMLTAMTTNTPVRLFVNMDASNSGYCAVQAGSIAKGW